LTARRVRLALALAPVLCCAGCNDYLSRRDTATLESGEAVQANMAIHVIDPSPPASARIVNNTDGERLQRGIERYRNPQAGLGGFGAPAAVPIGASAVPPVGNSLSR
jgi:type IV pilus biogenesis protein CpaD/CtpE